MTKEKQDQRVPIPAKPDSAEGTPSRQPERPETGVPFQLIPTSQGWRNLVRWGSTQTPKP